MEIVCKGKEEEMGQKKGKKEEGLLRYFLATSRSSPRRTDSWLRGGLSKNRRKSAEIGMREHLAGTSRRKRRRRKKKGDGEKSSIRLSFYTLRDLTHQERRAS